jgi:hypothetical protein
VTGCLRKFWPEYTTLVLYGSLVALAIPFHEPSADEAQAWMMARSLTIWQLFHTYLRYEGSPGLWHLLLWLLVHLHVSFTGMHWLCGFIALAATAVLVLCSPLPRWMRLTLPFTYFLAFQYAVVARNYVLVPLLLFSIAALWKRSPTFVALLLGLLANVAGHAAAIAIGFSLLYWIEQRNAITRAQRWKCAGIFGAMLTLAIWTIMPPHDVYVATYHSSGSESTPPLLAAIGRAQFALFWGSYPSLIGLLAWPLIVRGIRQRSGTHYLFPIAALIGFSAAVYLNFWHAGLIVPTLVVILWLTWPSEATPPQSELDLRYCITALLLTQVGWTVHALIYDHFHDYSPNLAAARFLTPYVARGNTVAVTYLRDSGVQSFDSVGIAPYFSKKLYMNQDTPFWWWSIRDHTEANFLSALHTHPGVVVVEYFDMVSFLPSRDLNNPKVRLIESDGYQLTATFCATKPEMFGTREVFCHLFYLPVKIKLGGNST